MNDERKLVTIRVVSEIKPIPNADNIELAVVDGWQCVVKKGEFKTGDRGIYFEIDSFIPMGKEYFEFLRKDAREWNGIMGTRIRTIKLRGQISQGLLLPASVIPSPLPLQKGQDLDHLAEYFGVTKWERDLPPQEIRKDSWFDPIVRFFIPKKYRAAVFTFIYSKSRAAKAKAKSSFPSFIPKTDQERIQNVIKDKLTKTGMYEATGKMDGSSMTVYVKNGEFGHCSRNVKLGLEDGSKFSAMVKKLELNVKLPAILKELDKELPLAWQREYAIQGELCGPGIQENFEQLEELDFFVFAIFDIQRQLYLPPSERKEVLRLLADKGLVLNTVPYIGEVTLTCFNSIDDYLSFAEGPSYKASKREGVVFVSADGQDSFKCVTTSYLLKKGE